MSPTQLFTVQLTGTSPLSFEVKTGSSLCIKKFSESNKQRPTLGKRFEASVLIVFHGITKVGQINKKDLRLFEDYSKYKLVALEVCKDRKKFIVGAFI